MLRASTMKKESKEDSRADFVSLRILGTLSCVPSNRWTMRVQQVVQVTSMQGLPHFNPFLEENNFIHHLYCQTQRMFTWDLTAALLDKGKVSARGDSTERGLPAGSLPSAGWIYAVAEGYEQHWRGSPTPPQVRMATTSSCTRYLFKWQPQSTLQPVRHCRVLDLGWELLVLPLRFQAINSPEARARKMPPVNIALSVRLIPLLLKEESDFSLSTEMQKII